MLVISSREFRQNQRLYFDKADKGESIIVQRGKDKAYALTPVSEDDLYFNTIMIKRIKLSLEQAKKGQVTTISSSEEIKELIHDSANDFALSESCSSLTELIIAFLISTPFLSEIFATISAFVICF